MSRTISILPALALGLLAGATWWWLNLLPHGAEPARPSLAADSARPPGGIRRSDPFRSESERSRQNESLSAHEKAARIARITRDYDDIRAKAVADFAVAGAAFPGGLHAFLRQLALIEREKRLDLAKVLPPPELEDLERRETAAGQIVQELLGNTAASEDQRRAVFRLRLEFEDRFGLAFDSSPSAQLECERARCAMQENVRTVLGDELFADWLRDEGAEFGHLAGFVAQHGLPAAAALELWRTKNELNLRRLEIVAQPNLTVERSRAAYAEAARQAQVRLIAHIGSAAVQTASHDVLGWLPRW